MIRQTFLQEFVALANSKRQDDLVPAALRIAQLAYPCLDPVPYLDRLNEMGESAARRIDDVAPDPQARLGAINQYLYDEQGFAGNREDYDDPRNSFLNEVLDRRTGIPITLGLVYIEVARRAGVLVEGVNFPGHFLLRYPSARDALILDPFEGGTVLSETDCRNLLYRHLGNDAVFDRRLLGPATKRQILLRVLGNLKRQYVRLRSLPQARDILDLMVALDPSNLAELRDRGLVAYHLNDYSTALGDLEAYLRLASRSETDADTRKESAEIWEHVKTLRRRIASLN